MKTVPKALLERIQEAIPAGSEVIPLDWAYEDEDYNIVVFVGDGEDPRVINPSENCCENCWDSGGKMRGMQGIPGEPSRQDFPNKKRGISLSPNDLLIPPRSDLKSRGHTSSPMPPRLFFRHLQMVRQDSFSCGVRAALRQFQVMLIKHIITLEHRHNFLPGNLHRGGGIRAARRKLVVAVC